MKYGPLTIIDCQIVSRSLSLQPKEKKNIYLYINKYIKKNKKKKKIVRERKEKKRKIGENSYGLRKHYVRTGLIRVTIQLFHNACTTVKHSKKKSTLQLIIAL